jgi:hypothetical protein
VTPPWANSDHTSKNGAIANGEQPTPHLEKFFSGSRIRHLAEANGVKSALIRMLAEPLRKSDRQTAPSWRFLRTSL